MRLTRAQQDARDRIEQLARLGQDPATLAAGIGAALSLAAPNDGYRIFGTDPATLLINQLLAATDSDDWARREWLGEVYLRADPLPYIELPTLMRLRLPVVASHSRQAECWGFPSDILATLTEREHERAFHEVGSPAGGTILANFASRGRWVASMQMYRRDPGHPFTRSEVAFVRSAGARIGDALAAAIAREKAERPAGPAERAPGVVVLAADSEQAYASPAGEHWLDVLRDVDARPDAGLPAPVAAAVAGLRAGASARQQVAAPTPLGLVTVEATPGGGDGSVAVVLTLQQPPGPPEVPPAWPLTQQEREVVRLLLRGDGNRAIAAALFVSENTVQTHLRNIYGKLEVAGRTQLLARLFRESAGRELLDS